MLVIKIDNKNIGTRISNFSKDIASDF